MCRFVTFQTGYLLSVVGVMHSVQMLFADWLPVKCGKGVREHNRLE